MATFQITLPNTTARKAYKVFASALLDKVFSENDHVDQETVMQVRELRNRGDAILNELLAEVGKKGKSPAKKVTKKAKSPSKKQAKIDGLKAELIQLGGEVPTELTVTSLRNAIKAAKKAAKSAKKSTSPKAKKAKKKASLMDQANKRKALQAKKVAKAQAKLEAKAAKVQVKVDAIVEEILSYVALNNLNAADEKALRERVKDVDEHCTGSLTDGVTMKEMKSILKEQKSLKAKKAKSNSPRQQKMQKLQDELTEIGGDMPETVSVTTLRDAIKARKKQLKLDAKKAAKDAKVAAKAEKAAKKAAKAKLPKKPSNSYMIYANATRGDVRKENPELKMPEVTRIIAANWKDLAEDEKAPFVKAAAEDKVRYATEMEKLGLAVTKPKAAKKAKKTDKVTSSQKDLIAALVKDVVKDEDEDEKEVSDSDDSQQLEEEELSDLDEDSDDDEPVMPDDVEDFEHSSRPGEQLYIDEEFHVWNDDSELIGTYDAESKTLYED